ncbi:MAG: transketolase [Rickettsiaceae bacterium H1]|nr:transketolase [Rickettsiaceae bacterium H1]
MAAAIRILSLDAINRAKSGHPGMPIGMADVVTVLFTRFLKFNPKDPDWHDRDRFLLSAGHGSMLLYALLYLTGYEDITINEIENFRQLHAKTAGHPEYGSARGIENTSGPLGQGVGNAVGMAIAERILNNRFGDNLVNHYTYVIAGDGCLMEGISHESASLAGHLGLGKLILLFDDNNVSIDGSTDLTVSDDHMQRFSSYGWHTQSVDGHNYDEMTNALQSAKEEENKPSIIACKTIIGKFIPGQAGTAGAHSWPMTEKEVIGMRKNLNWEHEPFVVPDEIFKKWRSLGSEDDYEVWNRQITKEFTEYVSCNLPRDVNRVFFNLKKKLAGKTEPTRKSSGKILDVITEHIPQLLGGSADLSGSNNTKAGGMTSIEKDDFSGSYLHYGVREHTMSACMNGMALHKGIIPYGGTFFVFTDYCRPAIRLSALMKQRVVYIMTHDSIGLGEDGPTHQPVEHLPSLRAMPNVNVFRPADGVEVCESWELALQNINGPSILVLSRQAVSSVRTTNMERNMTNYGAYVIADSDKSLRITIFATGSEVQIAIAAKSILEEKESIGVRVVSMPCMELFDRQSKEYKDGLLKNNSLKVAIEAAVKFGWEKYIGQDGIFVGLDGFGASANADTLYEHFKITADNVVNSCKERLWNFVD